MDNSWMPPPGRRQVTIGTSLVKALKARATKGDYPASKSLHPRDFFSFRYNFKPPSVDPGRGGKIVVKKGKETTCVTLERPATQPGEVHLFSGTESPARDWECMLIYDEAQDSYTLEKLDALMTLKYDRKVAAPERITSPASAAIPDVDATSKRDTKVMRDREPGEALEDDGDDMMSFPRREEEEEGEEPEEGEMVPPPPRPQSQPLKRSTVNLKAAKAAPHKSATATAPASTPLSTTRTRPKSIKPKATTASRPPAAPAPTPAPAPAPTPAPAPAPAAAAAQTPVLSVSRGKKHKREPEPELETSSFADVEVLEFGQAARPVKRARQQSATQPPPPPPPPPKPSEGLALPGSLGTVTRPPPVVPPAQQTSAAPLSESEEEDWEDVVGNGAGGADGGAETDDDFDVFGDAAGSSALPPAPQDDMDDLEQQLMSQMQEDEEDEEEDFLLDVVEQASPSATAARGFEPMSLNAFASAGGVDYGSDDEYSSSDSDED